MFRKQEKFFRKTMTAVALDWPLVIGRVPDAVKQIASRNIATPRAAENWLQGRAKPSGDNVVQLFAHFPEVADAILEATKRNEKGLTWEQRTKLLQILGEG